MNRPTYLCTGGFGFVGSCFIKQLLAAKPDCRIVNLDLCTYAADVANLAELRGDPRLTTRVADICDAALVDFLVREFAVTAVVNFAAESHVDRSIVDAAAFVRSNVLGVQNLLDCMRRHGGGRLLQVSTDEVYGSLGPAEPPFTEQTPLAPRNPYAASKAAAELLCLAAHRTHNQDVVITRCSNNYGPGQYPEKLIPCFIRKLVRGEKVPVYGDGLQVRDWIHVDDHCRAVQHVLHNGLAGEVYNVGADSERTNLQLVRSILTHLDLSDDRIEYVKDRLGHDRRYAIDSSKIRKELGWTPRHVFDKSFFETVDHYCAKFRGERV